MYARGPMSKLDLRVRNLETGELFLATFESEVDAAKWLLERPQGVEVRGVATHGLGREVYTMLRTASRALDADEQAMADRLDAAEREARAQADEAARREDEAEMEAYREAQRTADPNRPMALRWTREGGIEKENVHDPRDLSEVVREAVAAWIAERDGWVADRGMVVGEALLTVWPAEVPADETRVQRGGQFFPVSAPSKDAAR